MKAFSTIVLSVILVGSLAGCGKTLGELRTNGDAIVDNGEKFVNETVSTVGTIVKKLLGVGIAVYDIGKKMVEDVKDNGSTVINTVTGADNTPAAPATK
jgi:hypothetical protein